MFDKGAVEMIAVTVIEKATGTPAGEGVFLSIGRQGMIVAQTHELAEMAAIILQHDGTAIAAVPCGGDTRDGTVAGLISSFIAAIMLKEDLIDTASYKACIRIMEALSGEKAPTVGDCKCE